jgi:exopolysaccharide biosynthesis polyprenyl glycosylphosphotransferase
MITSRALSGAVEKKSAHVALQFSERRLLLMLVDTGLLVSAAIGALVGWAALRKDVMFGPAFLMQQIGWLIALPTFWVGLLAVHECYDLQISARIEVILRRLFSVCLTFAIAYVALFFLTSSPAETTYLPVGFVADFRLLRVAPVLFIAAALPLEIVWRGFYAALLTGEHFQRRALVIGSGHSARTLVQAFHSAVNSGYQVLGYVDEDPSQVGKAFERLNVIGSHSTLLELVSQNDIDELVLATNPELSGKMFEAIMECVQRGIQVTLMPLMYERLTGRVPVEHIGQQWYLSLELSVTPPDWAYRVIQRGADIAFGAAGVALLGLLSPFVAAANALWSPGPLFYRQTRVGRAGRLFQVIKFRTMVPDAEKNGGAVWTAENDGRVTPVGHWLRATRLDETPQCWNMLRGDMSIVGPRPERPEFIDELTEKIPFYRSRLAVKPGITGWAQVRYHYGASVEDALIKLQYDLFYIKHQSVPLDLYVLFRTVGVILGLKGR